MVSNVCETWWLYGGGGRLLGRRLVSAEREGLRSPAGRRWWAAALVLHGLAEQTFSWDKDMAAHDPGAGDKGGPGGGGRVAQKDGIPVEWRVGRGLHP